jgi:hypothetical protein
MWTNLASESLFKSCKSGHMAVNTFMRLSILGLCLSITARAGELETFRDPDSGLLTWKFEEGGFSLQLIQLLPEYVQALYTSRNLGPGVAESMKGYCVFGSVIRNDTDRQLSYRVAEWRYVGPSGIPQPPKTKSEWLAEWRELGSTYNWSILPDDQVFEPGDWSQGFTTVALPPGSAFDLVVNWRVADERHESTLAGLRCAPAQAPSR